MSWYESLLCSAVRSFLVAALGTYLAAITRRWLLNLSSTKRKISWLFVLLPFFVPSLMTGYCFRDTSMSLVHHQWLRELLYALLNLLQSIPVGVIILYFSPQPADGKSSLYSAKLLSLKLTERLKILRSSHYQYFLAAFCVIYLISFQESDLAALMQASGWTEWMFTKHVGGLALRDTMILSLGPVLIQTLLLLPIVFWLGSSSRSSNGVVSANQQPLKIKERMIVWLWMLTAFILVFFIPLLQIAKGTKIGIANLSQQPAIFSELGDAILLATTTALLTILIAGASLSIKAQKLPRSLYRTLLFCLLLPGSMGSLALGLLFAGIFQTDIFLIAYDTPVPLLLGEVFITLPKAMVLIYCIGKMTSNMERHWITLFQRAPLDPFQTNAKILNWQLSGQKKFAVLIIIWFWAYFEVMLPSILAMPGLAPIGLVLYNNLHYGRIAALGAKLALMLTVPILFGVCIFLLKRKTS